MPTTRSLRLIQISWLLQRLISLPLTAPFTSETSIRRRRVYVSELWIPNRWRHQSDKSACEGKTWGKPRSQTLGERRKLSGVCVWILIFDGRINRPGGSPPKDSCACVFVGASWVKTKGSSCPVRGISGTLCGSSSLCSSENRALGKPHSSHVSCTTASTTHTRPR